MTSANSGSVNWAGNYTYRAAESVTPATVEALQEAVSQAHHAKALGSRHSFNDIADTTGVQVSAAGLAIEPEIDGTARTVTVGGGARYGEFVERLHRAGFAIHNLASLPHISVAGAVSTGTHGSGDRNGGLATAVAAVEFVRADGVLHSIRRGDADFDGAVVALGALGVVTRITLDLQPAFDVRQDVFEHLSWAALDDHFDEITSGAYSVSLFTDWGEQAATQVWLKSRTDAPSPAATAPEFFGAVRATRARHPLPDGPAEYATEQLGVPGPWWNRLPHFRLEFTPSNGAEIQSEYLLPREHAIAAAHAMHGLRELLAPHLFVSEIRTMAGDDLWLSPAYGRDTVGFHFTWMLHDEVDALLPVLDETLAPFHARPHWGKVFSTDPGRLAGLYPRLADFRDLATRLDPDGKFRGPFLDRTVFA